jgi:SulP family sulfate permease
MVGTFTGALATSSAFMAVQGTGAMAMIMTDVPALHSASDPGRALVTLSVLTGVAMLAAGVFQLGSALRFVSKAVMVGFINAVGVNIVLGQLANFTGYAPDGPNRVVRAVATLAHPGSIHPATLLVGVCTIGLILAMERTRVGALGLVVAVVVTSAAVAVFGSRGVAILSDLGEVPRTLPTPELPVLSLVPALIVPALSLAFVGLVQGASISANFPNPDGTYPDVSRDFVGQGVANLGAGVFRGMPVGGSLSASSLNQAAGARSRLSLLIAGVVIAVVVVAFGGLVGSVAMPALAGLLILIGCRTIKLADLRSVWLTGPVQKVVLVVTFALTMIIPLQYAVLVGVGLSVVLHVIRQSNQVVLKLRQRDAEGHVIEVDPPTVLPADEVVVLQPYGSLFFAAAPVFESLLPAPNNSSSNTVVILRLRGRDDLGATLMDVLGRYADALATVGSKLVLVSTNSSIEEQLEVAGVTGKIGRSNLYRAEPRVGAAMDRANADARAWIARDRPDQDPDILA